MAQELLECLLGLLELAFLGVRSSFEYAADTVIVPALPFGTDRGNLFCHWLTASHRQCHSVLAKVHDRQGWHLVRPVDVFHVLVVELAIAQARSQLDGFARV